MKWCSRSQCVSWRAWAFFATEFVVCLLEESYGGRVMGPDKDFEVVTLVRVLGFEWEWRRPLYDGEERWCWG